MRAHEPIVIRVHTPEGEAGRRELAARAAEAHAEAVFRAIDALDGSAREKLALVQAVMDAAEASDRQL